eukprot:TRINITY_DN869_c0_g1_i1.p1 TRINITY_DN869_c0_g1~~TRINITY_DN869_c0_g1_i1.p1  ORF type:complete len:338 (+),score=156.15 TRINITY_DN869_c0_g1_i1:67-1014(+)
MSGRRTDAKTTSMVAATDGAIRRHAAAKLMRLLAKEQGLKALRGIGGGCFFDEMYPFLPEDDEEEAAPAPKGKGAPAAKKGGKLEQELVTAEEACLPLAKVPPVPCGGLPGAAVFSYAALKTKARLSTGLGPAKGSTWLWFVVGDVDVAATKGGGRQMRLSADKFQAGWAKTADGGVELAELRPRQHAMLECVSAGKVSDYGKGRRGVPVGFSHQWNYSDSKWEMASGGWGTAGCEWKETKGTDRWRVDVAMQWLSDAAAEGRYVVVAEQRAEKINRNQYGTAMRGALFYVGSDAERDAALRHATAAYKRSTQGA